MTDTKLIERFTAFCDELNATQGTNKKILVLNEYLDLEPIVRRMFDATTTGVTAASVKKYIDAGKPVIAVDTDVLQTYDDLATRKLSGDTARGVVAGFVKQYGDVALKIFEKKPRIRLGQAVLKTVFKQSFERFGVELAQEFNETDLAKLKSPVMSKKFDGMRAVAIITDEVKFVSRTNKPITSAKVLEDEIATLGLKNVVLDGEIEVGDFKNTISQARRQNVQMSNPIYHIFNIVSLEEFLNYKPDNSLYSERIKMLSGIKGEHLRIVEQTPYTKSNFDELVEHARVNGWEGIMIRGDAPYEPKRTKNLLKYKFTLDGEFRVVDATIEDMAFPEGGGEVVKKALKNVIIHHLGDAVHVGSGFSREERLEFAKDASAIIGKNIIVEYQEPFVDKDTGKNSLRCPIYKGVIGAERDF